MLDSGADENVETAKEMAARVGPEPRKVDPQVRNLGSLCSISLLTKQVVSVPLYCTKIMH